LQGHAILPYATMMLIRLAGVTAAAGNSKASLEGLSLDNTLVPLKAAEDTGFEEWKVELGQEVKVGNVLYTVNQWGQIKEVIATEDGFVDAKDDTVKPGDSVKPGTVLAVTRSSQAMSEPSTSLSGGLLLSPELALITLAEDAVFSKWMVALDQTVQKGQVLCKIKRGNVFIEVTSTEAGIMDAVDTNLKEGTSITAGEPIGAIRRGSGKSNSLPVSDPGLHLVNVTEDATLMKWMVEEGEEVTEGQVLFMLKKGTHIVEVPAQKSGTIAALESGIPQGSLIKAGTTLAVIRQPSPPGGGLWWIAAVVVGVLFLLLAVAWRWPDLKNMFTSQEDSYAKLPKRIMATL